MRAIVRSSSWLNDTLCLRTAWNSLTGIATRPKLIVPVHTGRGIPSIMPDRRRRRTSGGRTVTSGRNVGNQGRGQRETNSANQPDRTRPHEDEFREAGVRRRAPLDAPTSVLPRHRSERPLALHHGRAPVRRRAVVEPDGERERHRTEIDIRQHRVQQQDLVVAVERDDDPPGPVRAGMVRDALDLLVADRLRRSRAPWTLQQAEPRHAELEPLVEAPDTPDLWGDVPLAVGDRGPDLSGHINHTPAPSMENRPRQPPVVSRTARATMSVPNAVRIAR